MIETENKSQMDGWRDIKQEQLRDTEFWLSKTGREGHNAHVGAEETKERERGRLTGCNAFYNTLNPGVGSDRFTVI